MTHDCHTDLPGYDERQLFVSGCRECERRGASLRLALSHMDGATFGHAWRRAANWGRYGECEATGPFSSVEVDVLDALWTIEVMLERTCRLPIGELPHAELWA